MLPTAIRDAPVYSEAFDDIENTRRMMASQSQERRQQGKAILTLSRIQMMSAELIS